MKLESITTTQLDFAIISAYERYYKEQTTEVKKALERAFYRDWKNAVSSKPFEEFLCEFLSIGTKQRLQGQKAIKLPIELGDFFMLIDKQVRWDGLKLMERIGKIYGGSFVLKSAISFFDTSLRESATPLLDLPKDLLVDSGPKF